MTCEQRASSVEARLDALERQAAVWRRIAICTLCMLAIGGTMAFRQLAPGPLESSSQTMLAPRGDAVTLSLRPSGALEARFSRSAAGLTLVNPGGREVLRLGDPSARQLAP